SIRMNAFKLLAAFAGLTAAVSGADFFPLQEGNVWTYRKAGTGQTFSISVGQEGQVGPLTYHLLQGYAAEAVLVRLDDQKNLVSVDPDTGQEQVLTDFTVSQDGWWDAPARQCREQGQTLDRGAIHDGPAGAFEDVREINYRVIGCADVGVTYEQYAANVG